MTNLNAPTPFSMTSFYLASLCGLRAVEARKVTGRRFGTDADALWHGFKGHLDTADRIDLLLRDAAVAWPTAFAPSQVFGMSAVAEDDPFGPEWEPLDQAHAEDVWRSLTDVGQKSPFDILAACAAAWELKLTPVRLVGIDASTRIFAVGPSAVASLTNLFAENRDLDFTSQVACVASLPSHRHIAGLAAAVLNAQKGTTLLAPAESAKHKRPDMVVAGPDAFPSDLAWAQAQAGS